MNYFLVGPCKIGPRVTFVTDDIRIDIDHCRVQCCIGKWFRKSPESVPPVANSQCKTTGRHPRLHRSPGYEQQLPIVLQSPFCGRQRNLNHLVTSILSFDLCASSVIIEHLTYPTAHTPSLITEFNIPPCRRIISTCIELVVAASVLQPPAISTHHARLVANPDLFTAQAWTGRLPTNVIIIL